KDKMELLKAWSIVIPILELFKKLEQFNYVSTIIQYQNWAHSVTDSTLVHSSHDFLPIIDKWIIAIQMGLDAGPSAIQELNNIMKNYKTLLDNLHNVENYSNIADDTDSNSINDDDGSYSEENDENINSLLIQNPII
ncbi:45643_t:CDS:2, partial [Gigaspora margarita]